MSRERASELKTQIQSLNRHISKHLEEYEDTIERQRKQLIVDINREKSKIFDHFKELMQQTSSPDATKLLRRVRLASAGKRSENFSTPSRQFVTLSLHNMDQLPAEDIAETGKEQDTEVEEKEDQEVLIRKLKRKLTDLLIEGLKQTKVHVNAQTIAELQAEKTPDHHHHTPCNTSLKKRLSLLSSSSPDMAKRRMSLLAARPVASHLDSGNRRVLCELQHVMDANQHNLQDTKQDACKASEHNTKPSSSFVSGKPSESSRLSPAASRVECNISDTEGKRKQLQQHSETTADRVGTRQKQRQSKRSLPKIWKL